MNQYGVWTPARIQVLRDLWPTHTARQMILARINALPGKRLSDYGIRVKASKLDIKRPDDFRIKWTPERSALLRALVPHEPDDRVITDRINALPGLALEQCAVVAKARRLMIKRTPECIERRRSMNMDRPIWRTPPILVWQNPQPAPVVVAPSAPSPPPVVRRTGEKFSMLGGRIR